MKIVWTRRAVLNLHDVREHIRLENPAASVKIGARIEAAVERLARFPDSGRGGEVPGTRELVLSDSPYIIVYRSKGDTVAILRVLHDRQKWPSSL